MADFVASHRVPAAGAQTWPEPDPSLAPGPSLGAGVLVVIDERRGEWAHVRCDNGWHGWVDARLLEPIAAAPAAPPATPGPAPSPSTTRPSLPIVPLAGAAAAAVAAVLSWFSLPGVSENGFDVPIGFLFDNETTSDSGLSIGLLAIVLAAGAALGVVRGPDTIRRIAGGALMAVSAVYVVQVQRLLATFEDLGMSDVPGITDAVGIGALVAFVGGAVVALAPTGRPR